MAITGLNHVNFRSHDIAATVEFYCDLFGMTHRARDVSQGRTLNWLYDSNGRPVIHINPADTAPMATDSMPIDHIAFDCTDLPAVIARLEARHIAYRTIAGVVPGVTQLFFHDPVIGARIELSFAEALPTA